MAAQVYTPFGGALDPDPRNAVSVVGWSALAVIITLALGFGLMLVPVLLGFCCRYASGLPIVESCSFAISAACHAPGEDRADAILKYGICKSMPNGRVVVGLSGEDVEELIDGSRDHSQPNVKVDGTESQRKLFAILFIRQFAESKEGQIKKPVILHFLLPWMY